MLVIGYVFLDALCASIMYAYILCFLNLSARWLHPTQPFQCGWGELSLPIKPKRSSSSVINNPFPEERRSCPKLSDSLSSSMPDAYTRNHTSQTHSSHLFCSGHHRACCLLFPIAHGATGECVLFRNDQILGHLFLR